MKKITILAIFIFLFLPLNSEFVKNKNISLDILVIRTLVRIYKLYPPDRRDWLYEIELKIKKDGLSRH